MIFAKLQLGSFEKFGHDLEEWSHTQISWRASFPAFQVLADCAEALTMEVGLLPTVLLGFQPIGSLWFTGCHHGTKPSWGSDRSGGASVLTGTLTAAAGGSPATVAMSRAKIHGLYEKGCWRLINS